MARRVGGIIQLELDGARLFAKGAFEYDLGVAAKESVVGMDGFHGFKETPKPARISGQITDAPELDLEALLNTRNATVKLSLANGKTVVMREAFYAGDNTANTEEGEIEVAFEGPSAEEFS